MSTLDLVRKLSHGPLLSDRALVSPSGQAKIGAAYLALPEFDPAAVAAFEAMRREVSEQFRLLVSHGFSFEVTAGDPYGSAREMFADVEQNRHIAVLSTQITGGHPFFSEGENDRFRAVHDVFGHFASQRGFDRHGEESAYRRHSLMFSELAARAMATETRGQNAALILTGEFAAERIAILPNWARDAYALVPEGPAEWCEVREHSQTCEIPAP